MICSTEHNGFPLLSAIKPDNYLLIIVHQSCCIGLTLRDTKVDLELNVTLEEPSVHLHCTVAAPNM